MTPQVRQVTKFIKFCSEQLLSWKNKLPKHHLIHITKAVQPRKASFWLCPLLGSFGLLKHWNMVFNFLWVDCLRLSETWAMSPPVPFGRTSKLPQLSGPARPEPGPWDPKWSKSFPKAFPKAFPLASLSFPLSIVFHCLPLFSYAPTGLLNSSYLWDLSPLPQAVTSTLQSVASATRVGKPHKGKRENFGNAISNQTNRMIDNDFLGPHVSRHPESFWQYRAYRGQVYSMEPAPRRGNNHHVTKRYKQCIFKTLQALVTVLRPTSSSCFSLWNCYHI